MNYDCVKHEESPMKSDMLRYPIAGVLIQKGRP